MLPEAEEKLETTPPKSDRWNIIILLATYTIQSIPKGLSEAVPLVLQSRGATYNEQAAFHLVQLPFVFKLLWAPLVDSTYSRRFGQRKSWVIPSQFLMGFTFLILYFKIEYWLGGDVGTEKPKIVWLTITFFFCNVCRATHDIALDGWSLTILQRRNVGHAGTVNMIGYTIGYSIGYTVFTTVTTKKFSISWLGKTPEPMALVSISGFLLFWSVITIIATVLLWIFKRDNSMDDMKENDEIRIGFIKSFRVLKDMFKMEHVRSLCVIIIISRGLFAPCLGVTSLKLIDAGVARDEMVLLSIPLIPCHMILPFLLKRYLVGPQNMNYYPRLIGGWLVITVLYAALVYVAPFMRTSDAKFPWYFYALLFVVDGLEKTTYYSSALSLQAFFARISDPYFGGTYITFLNTVANLGKDGCIYISLLSVNLLTWKKCAIADNVLTIWASEPIKKCSIIVDGYFIQIIISLIIGTVWLNCSGGERIRKIANVKETAWLLPRRRRQAKTQANLITR